MILTGFCRLGKDAELRYTSGDNATAVTNLALAFNYGRRDDDGNRPTQWVEAVLWGQRAEALVDHLQKGQGLDVVLEDVHIENYESNNGGGSKLVGRVVMIEFTGSNPNGQGGGNGGGQQQRQGNTQERGGQQQQQRTQGNGQRQQQGNQRTQGNGQQRGGQQQQRTQGGNGRNAYSDAKNGNGRGGRSDFDDSGFE